MKKTKGPKSHHYVPKMLLKRFANESGTLFYFDKSEPEKGIRERSPKNLFEETHLYSLISEDGSKDPRIEMDFGKKIEDPANHVLDRMLASVVLGKVPNLSEQDREIWDQFFYLQWKRTPEHLSKTVSHQWPQAILNGFLNEYEAMGLPLTNEDRIKFQNQTHRNRIINNAKIEAVAKKGEMVTNVL
jgi:hypothetical protein